MGTNFYLMLEDEICPTCNRTIEDEDTFHIGKRSAAGLYCFDCNMTLCKAGNYGIHRSRGYYTMCPICGKEPSQESLDDSTVGLELGFAEPRKGRGVRSCSSFTWAIEEKKFIKMITDGYIIKDEYGKKYTYEKFVDDILDNCPIKFLDSIGINFS